MIEHMYALLMSNRAGSAVAGHGDLDAELGEIAGQLNLLNARLVATADRVSASGEWRENGMKSPAQYLAWRLGLSPERARQIVRVAEHRSSFPTIVGAFDRGELSLEQVVEVVKAPAWADAQLLDIASISTVTKLRRAMRSTMFDGEPVQPGEATTGPKQAADRLSFGVAGNGRWRINGEFGIDDGRRIEAALTERRDALFTAGDESVTWPQTLSDCCARSLGAVESPSRRDQYRTWIHLDVTSGDATTTDGWRIPEAVRHHALCDGVVQPVWERDGSHSPSAAPIESSPTGPDVSSSDATAAAGCPAALPTGSSRSTTSNTGSTVGRPTRPTSSVSARPTTGSTIGTSWASAAMRTTSTG